MKINLDTLQLDTDDQIQAAEKVEHKYRISFANSCYLWPEEWEWAPRRPSTLGSVITQFSSVAQSCPTLCDPRDCSMPGLPVHHQLLEFT